MAGEAAVVSVEDGLADGAQTNRLVTQDVERLLLQPAEFAHPFGKIGQRDERLTQRVGVGRRAVVDPDEQVVIGR